MGKRSHQTTATRTRRASAKKGAEGRRQPKFALLVIRERATSALFTLPESGEVTLGRSDQCALQIDDPLLSRVHAVVRRAGDHYEVLDRGSMNGTWVGDDRLAPNAPHPLRIGDVIKLGKANIVLQFAAGGTRPRRVWSHGYFEARLEEECIRADQGGKPFAVVRVHGAPSAAQEVVERTLVEMLRPVDVLAMFTEGEYGALLLETSPQVAQALREEIEGRLKLAGVVVQVAVACHPIDGHSPESLVSRAAGGAPVASASNARDAVREGALAHMQPLVDKVAASAIHVLLLGETGVGKEVVARMIHERSARKSAPFVRLRCASLSEQLLERELFGYEKGAFPGALLAKPGVLESAAGGTVFLDEVAEMPLSLQAKLVRAIEHGEVVRAGAKLPRPFDVRFVAATRRDLDHEVAGGHFRGDLQLRLGAFAIAIPPLRERSDEIAGLARHFVALACKRAGRTRLTLTTEAIDFLRAQAWPGNVRELENVIDRAVLLCRGARITSAHVTREPMGRVVSSSLAPSSVASIYDASFEPTHLTKIDLAPIRGREVTRPPPPLVSPRKRR